MGSRCAPGGEGHGRSSPRFRSRSEWNSCGGGESEAAWRGILDGLIARGLRAPEFLVTGGGAGLERALAALWPDAPAQRCPVHKHRNLLAHAPEALHEEVSADDTDMIYAETATQAQAKRNALPLAGGGPARR